MNDEKKILTIQDISCYGQCSITVALPILSAFGIETAVIPSAVLSTHTSGFTGYTVRDLTEDLPDIRKHWESEGIYFDAIYTGFISSDKHHVFVDPAMADNGEFYNGFDQDFADKMGELCKIGDFILPNTTEACYLLHREWKDNFSIDEMLNMAEELASFTKRYVILKGVNHKDGELGMIIYDKENPDDTKIVYNEKIDYITHGTGDVFASVFVGSENLPEKLLKTLFHTLHTPMESNSK